MRSTRSSIASLLAMASIATAGAAIASASALGRRSLRSPTVQRAKVSNNAEIREWNNAVNQRKAQKLLRKNR